MKLFIVPTVEMTLRFPLREKTIALRAKKAITELLGPLGMRAKFISCERVPMKAGSPKYGDVWTTRLSISGVRRQHPETAIAALQRVVDAGMDAFHWIRREANADKAATNK